MFKIVSKCLANGSKPFLNDIISDSQTALIKRRQIFDNTIIGFECMHMLKGIGSDRNGS